MKKPIKFNLKPLVVSFLPAWAMAIYPFILIQKKEYALQASLINHERIHLRQQLELLLLPFYIIYLLNYLWNLIKFRNHNQAYRQIVFEKEAYAHENNLNYLKTRGFWAWTKNF